MVTPPLAKVSPDKRAAEMYFPANSPAYVVVIEVLVGISYWVF
jgi:hypothetical protein